MTSTNKHLWEIDHPYYCSESNWFSNGCCTRHDSWAAFDMRDSDLDLDLLFRWDWVVNESGVHTLKTFWMQQRKGRFTIHFVRVTPEDEPEIREWLKTRWAHMQVLWEGVTGLYVQPPLPF